MNREENLQNRALELEDRAVLIEGLAASQIREAYRIGYNDGYLQCAEDESENKAAKPRPVQPGPNVRGKYPPAPGLNDGTRPMRRECLYDE